MFLLFLHGLTLLLSLVLFEYLVLFDLPIVVLLLFDHREALIDKCVELGHLRTDLSQFTLIQTFKPPILLDDLLGRFPNGANSFDLWVRQGDHRRLRHRVVEVSGRHLNRRRFVEPMLVSAVRTSGGDTLARRFC